MSVSIFAAAIGGIVGFGFGYVVGLVIGYNTRKRIEIQRAAASVMHKTRTRA